MHSADDDAVAWLTNYGGPQRMHTTTTMENKAVTMSNINHLLDIIMSLIPTNSRKKGRYNLYALKELIYVTDKSQEYHLLLIQCRYLKKFITEQHYFHYWAFIPNLGSKKST